MVFVRAVKNKAYFKRFQTKKRRRREGKTDYHARNSLIVQDKDKYEARKLRFVVRITNSCVICQVVSAKVIGDEILASARSTELIKYGIPAGLTNYSAAYATGLLAARKALRKLKRDTVFAPVIDDSKLGEEYHVEDEITDAPVGPVTCFLDVGVTATTKGCRKFAAMKGACDGGLNVPHSAKCFPGYTKAEGKGEDSYNAEEHRDRILGKHVGDYMEKLKAEDAERYNKQFSGFIKKGMNSSGLKAMYTEAFKKIRADPTVGDTGRAKKSREGKVKKTSEKKTGMVVYTTKKGKYVRFRKLTKAQRRETVANKLAAYAKQMTA